MKGLRHQHSFSGDNGLAQMGFCFFNATTKGLAQVQVARHLVAVGVATLLVGRARVSPVSFDV